MKKYIKCINVVLNSNYSKVERFKSLSSAIKKYEEIKTKLFYANAIEEIYESGERKITDEENTLKLKFVYERCRNEDFEFINQIRKIKNQNI